MPSRGCGAPRGAFAVFLWLQFRRLLLLARVVEEGMVRCVLLMHTHMNKSVCMCVCYSSCMALVHVSLQSLFACVWRYTHVSAEPSMLVLSQAC